MQTNLDEIKQFLGAQTPDSWLKVALSNLPILLIDHAHCEKKAASTALSLIYRYPQYENLLQKLSRLAREELRHFEQVLKLIKKHELQFNHLTPSRYASSLRQHVRTHEPAKLVDQLIISAFIEARSCERFALLAPHLPQELSLFYFSLLKAEARHYRDYLNLAALKFDPSFDERIVFFRELEAELILSPDPEFRFHSGVSELPDKSK
ncbi:MAG: tRNA-(ms[2]io[6]A)-hydroxylase [Gammaproteobacteria bacterium]